MTADLLVSCYPFGYICILGTHFIHLFFSWLKLFSSNNHHRWSTLLLVPFQLILFLFYFSTMKKKMSVYKKQPSKKKKKKKEQKKIRKSDVNIVLQGKVHSSLLSFTTLVDFCVCNSMIYVAPSFSLLLSLYLSFFRLFFFSIRSNFVLLFTLLSLLTLYC